MLALERQRNELARFDVPGIEHDVTPSRTTRSETRANTSRTTPSGVAPSVAHTFGFDHQDENFNNANLGSCMDYTSDPDGPPSNEHPNQHDYDQLAAIYAHFDAFSTVEGSASAKSPVNPNDASE